MIFSGQFSLEKFKFLPYGVCFLHAKKYYYNNFSHSIRSNKRCFDTKINYLIKSQFEVIIKIFYINHLSNSCQIKVEVFKKKYIYFWFKIIFANLTLHQVQFFFDTSKVSRRFWRLCFNELIGLLIKLSKNLVVLSENHFYLWYNLEKYILLCQ